MNLLRGLGLPPALVGAARAIVEAAVLAAITAAIVAVSDLEGELAVYAPIAVALLRILEGLADQIDPSK